MREDKIHFSKNSTLETVIKYFSKFFVCSSALAVK